MTNRPLWLTITLLIIAIVVVLWTRCNAEEPNTQKVADCKGDYCGESKPLAKPEQVAALQAEITSLKALLASALADKEALEVQFQLQMQVCNSPELAIAKAKAAQAKKQAELAKPKTAPVEKK